ncbi:MAG: sugar phosphate isomerase/epimerase [Dictyoglomaceae bacterium]|nr:sugar phosphate isomerase/epimerase [Dictyoglomaceae bacterium]
MRIGSSTYSFKRFDYGNPEERKLKLEDMISLAYNYGLDGLEILAVQLESFEEEYLYKIKRFCVENSLDIYALSIHNNFVKPDIEERKKEIEKVKNLIKIGYKLGVPIIRVFGGRWGTIKDFTELMAKRGKEPALEGYTYEEGVKWNVSAFKECVDFAKEYGIILAIENHWGLTYSAEGVLDILKGVDSDWFKVALDCGNFLDDTYEQLEKLVPYTVLVHAKTYFGGGIFYDFDLNPDYVRILRMLKNVGYKGYLSIEFEGKANYEEGILASIELLSQALKIS